MVTCIRLGSRKKLDTREGCMTITEQGCSKFNRDQGHEVTLAGESGGDYGEHTSRTLLKDETNPHSQPMTEC